MKDIILLYRDSGMEFRVWGLHSGIMSTRILSRRRETKYALDRSHITGPLRHVGYASIQWIARWSYFALRSTSNPPKNGMT